MLRIYLIRHGETDHNKNRVIQGHDEVPLNDAGIAQAARLAERMRREPLDVIYASDLRRATMTAAIVAAATGAPLIYEPRLRERHPGELTGRSYEEAIRFFADSDYAPPGGESFAQFDARVAEAIAAVTARERPANGGARNIALVTHGMVCASFLRGAAGFTAAQMADIRWRNASLTIAEHDGAWRIASLADGSHLGEDDGSAPVIAGGRFSGGA